MSTYVASEGAAEIPTDPSQLAKDAGKLHSYLTGINADSYIATLGSNSQVNQAYVTENNKSYGYPTK